MLTREATPTQMAVIQPASARWRIVVAALAVFMLFFQLGSRGLNEPDEGRYAEVGREMAATGDWLVPHLNGVEHLSKPPITYWLIGLSIRAFGVNEFAARLPAALAGLGTLAAVFLLARSVWNDDGRVALWAVVALLTCIEFAVVARLITTDMILTCFVTWSVWWFWRWYISADRPWGKIAWFYVFLGLAMMTKGPVGVVLPMFAIFGLRWKNPNFKLRQMHWGKGMLAFVAIAAPWFVALAWRQPELWHYFLVRETFERVATDNLHRTKPFWFFVPMMLAGCWPWTPLLPALLRTPRHTTRERELARLCVGWWVLGFLLFTLSRSKLPTYIVPLYAPVALLIAPLVARAAAGLDEHEKASATWYAWAMITLQVAAIFGAACYAHRRNALPQATVLALTIVAGTGAISTAAMVVHGRLDAAAGAFVVTACAITIVATIGFQSVECNLGSQSSARAIGQRIHREDPAGRETVLAYRTSIRSLSFYSGHSVSSFCAANESEAGTEPTAASSLTEDGVRSLLRGQQRMFCVADDHYVETVNGLAGHPLTVFECCGPWVLLSNQPFAP
jgi:4-amino-4-deoxy-L-arabinose transferase-like glycosyltransferase